MKKALNNLKNSKEDATISSRLSHLSYKFYLERKTMVRKENSRAVKFYNIISWAEGTSQSC